MVVAEIDLYVGRNAVHDRQAERTLTLTPLTPNLKWKIIFF
jgi:hypothetical protein